MKQFVLILALLTVVAVNPAMAEIYKFTDKDGHVHYVHSLEKVPEEYRKQVSTSDALPPISKTKFRDVAPANLERSSTKVNTSAAIPALGRGKVELFVTSWCPHCARLEAFLKEKKISYKRYDIEKDKKGLNLYNSLGGDGVPMARVGSTVIQGYDPEGIIEALGKKIR